MGKSRLGCGVKGIRSERDDRACTNSDAKMSRDDNHIYVRHDFEICNGKTQEGGRG